MIDPCQNILHLLSIFKAEKKQPVAVMRVFTHHFVVCSDAWGHASGRIFLQTRIKAKKVLIFILPAFVSTPFRDNL
jgi:hypothetical protein